MGNDEQEKKLNETINNSNQAIKDALSGFNSIISNLMPQSPAKIIEIEVDGKKHNVSAYISMNNIICLDFTDKIEMKKYYDNLK